jgi:Ni,Fe-hydrogenase I cytochrome b subunit
MKRPRRLAFWFLLLALVAILAAGFYLGATHQETRPTDTNSPATTGPQG